MRTASPPLRTIGLSATAVLALVALAAAVPTDSLRAAVGPQTRTMQGETSAVRLVAAAVAAAARQLARVDHQSCVGAAIAFDLPIAAPAGCGHASCMPVLAGRILIEQLLDLPPPTC